MSRRCDGIFFLYRTRSVTNTPRPRRGAVGRIDVVERGSPGGARRFAGRGGLVTLATPRDALAVNAAASLSVMVRACDGPDDFTGLLSDRRVKAAVIGPGGGVGAPMRDLVLAALASRAEIVLDADAITSFVEDPKKLFTSLKSRDESPEILTPHEGEFMRIFKGKGSKNCS